MTLRYALGPFTSPTAVTTLSVLAATGATNLTVGALDFNGDGTNEITPGSLIVFYQAPATSEVHIVQGTASPNQLTLTNGIRNASGIPVGSTVAVVQESAFWAEGGNLMLRTAGANQQLAANVEDIQAVLITANGGIIGDGDGTNDGTDDTGAAYGDNPGGLSAAVF